MVLKCLSTSGSVSVCVYKVGILQMKSHLTCSQSVVRYYAASKYTSIQCITERVFI